MVMFVALSKFVVGNGMEAEVLEAFRNRPHEVDDAEGFVRMEVMTPRDHPEEFWLVTYWENEACWKSWYRSHAFKQAHTGMPKGLRLVPKSNEIRYFDLHST
jgi:heme-degrading monooxygenase HmoA